MVNRFSGRASNEAKLLGQRDWASRKIALLGGVALAALLSGVSGAKANCTGSGGQLLPDQPFTIASLVPFASGSAISSLVSAINAANTAFLTQSSAFIGSPPNPNPDQLGGGVWGRAIGGQFTTRGTATTNLTTLSDGAEVGTIGCSTTTRLNFAGFQVGTDVARLNWNGWNLHAGGTLGYMGANARDVSGAGPLDPQGGTFQNTLEVPFIGIYGAATYGGFFIDGQVRWNYYQNYLKDPVQNGLFGQRLDARGFTLTANIGYNHQFDSNFFLEPSAGVVWSRTTVDPLNVSGTLILANSPFLTFPGQVSINPIYSTLGRLSLRGGTTFEAGGVVLQPFATASVFHDFEGGQSATIETNFTSLIGPGLIPEFSGQLATSRLGTYGQFGLGTVAQIKDSGWLAYLRGDYRTGSKIDGLSLNGGVRYQLTGAAPMVVGRSADVPAAPVVVPYDWTGFYLGGFLGATWGETNWSFISQDFIPSINPRFAGLLGGGGVGYNYQIANVVLGIEGDFSWTNAKGASPCPNLDFFSCEADVKWLSTVTGRVGAVPFDRLLVYIKGGLALGEVKATGRCNTGSELIIIFDTPLNPGCPEQSMTKTAAGWTLGAGTELALTENWTVKAETNYFNLGSDRYTFGDLAPDGAEIERKGFISRVGINYRFSNLFGAQPIVAKY